MKELALRLCRHHRQQTGFVDLTTLALLLLLLVVVVFYRHEIRAKLESWTQSATVRISQGIKGLASSAGRMLEKLARGEFDLGGSDVMVKPGGLDELFTTQPDLAIMARTLPPMRTPIPGQVKLSPAAYCSPLLNPAWLDAGEARALHSITTQFSAPGSCGSRFCTPIPQVP
jgi:hypothetical protein